MNKYVAISVVAILVIGGGWWYFSQSNIATSPAMYKNSVLGLTFSIPTGLTVSEKDHYRENDPRSYLVTVANSDWTTDSDPTYYARLLANSTVEGTMGPDDVAATVSTTSISINGVEATKSVEHYADTGSTYLTFSLKSGADWYYFSFPYSSPQDQAYSDKIIQTIQFQ